jgi:hypothetical protein
MENSHFLLKIRIVFSFIMQNNRPKPIFLIEEELNTPLIL